MIKTTFAEFRSGRYNDNGESHELYILCDGDDDPIYVGKSTRGAWSRWFDGWNSHFIRNGWGEYIPITPVAKTVSANAPLSEKWIVELLTLADCVQLLENEIKALGFLPERADIDLAERILIKKLHPSENRALNNY